MLQMIPGLEERLMEGSDDDVVAIAEMVSLDTTLSRKLCIYCFIRFKRGRQAQDLMTPRASRARFWIGSSHVVRPLPHRWRVTSKWIVGSTTKEQAVYCAQLAWTGIPS